MKKIYLKEAKELLDDFTCTLLRMKSFLAKIEGEVSSEAEAEHDWGWEMLPDGPVAHSGTSPSGVHVRLYSQPGGAYTVMEKKSGEWKYKSQHKHNEAEAKAWVKANIA